MIPDVTRSFAAYALDMRHKVLGLAIGVVLGAACSNATARTMGDTTGRTTSNTTGRTSRDTTPNSSVMSTPGSAPAQTAPYTSAIYADHTHWICRGDTPNDVCHTAYPITEVAADGTLTVNPSPVAADPSVDCFYIYPTSSNDAGINSDLIADSEIRTTIAQAARFNQVCRVFVPVYRSVTLSALNRSLGTGLADGLAGSGSGLGDFARGWTLAYGDVLDAWRHYLANDNHGRPVVILAHSQGSFHAVRLLREEVDPQPEQRKLILSAMLAGTSFRVAPGSDVGGDTQRMPLCRANDQIGCVITFQTYRDREPPQPGALFGAPSATADSACTNPAALAGGPGVLDVAAPSGAWVFATPSSAPPITTSFVGVPGLIIGECKVSQRYHYLAITVNADPGDPRADDLPPGDIPNWGLHGLDLSLTQESLISLVRTETAAFLKG